MVHPAPGTDLCPLDVLSVTSVRYHLNFMKHMRVLWAWIFEAADLWILLMYKYVNASLHIAHAPVPMSMHMHLKRIYTRKSSSGQTAAADVQPPQLSRAVQCVTRRAAPSRLQPSTAVP